MAIGDLLWACPYCGAVGALAKEGRGRAGCAACGARFRRGAGASLRARTPGGTWEEHAPAAWLRRLPSIDRAFGDAPGREDRVEARLAGPDEVVRRAAEVLGFRETDGERVEGVLRLEGDVLTLEEDGGARRVWPLAELTAVQSSSRVVQVKARDRPVATFRFRTGSPRLWEELLQHALRRVYRARGRGEIREFQPRIVAR